MATGRTQSIRITGSTRLAEDEKQRMINEAEHYAGEDRKRREEVEKLNNADAICYQGEKTLADFGDKISKKLRDRIDTLLGEAREAIAKRDAVRAMEKAEELKHELQVAGGTIYAQSGAAKPRPQPDVGAPSGEARPSGSGPRGRVVDAEYKESD
jgi:molecular chaperone DnaK